MIIATIHIIAISFLSWFIVTKIGSDLDLRRWLWTGLAIRIAAGFSFGLIYLYYVGGGDTLYFFDQANELATLAKKDFYSYLHFLFSEQYPHFKSEARNGFFIKILSVFSIVTNNNYWITSLYFSILSFLGVAYLVKILSCLYPNQKLFVVISFLVIPSPIFWTSGIMKDSIIFSLLLYIAAIVILIQHNKKVSWIHFICISLGLFVMWKLRHFSAAIGMLALFSSFINQLFNQYKLSVKWRIFGWICCLTLGLGTLSLLNRNLNFDYLPRAIYDNYLALIDISRGVNQINFTSLRPNWIDLTISFPKSLVTGLYRPFIWEGSTFILPHKLENLAIIGLSLFSLKRISCLKIPNFLVSLAFCLILLLATLMPLAIPNFSSLVRYKAIFLPFLFYFLLIASFGESSKKEI